MRSSKDLLLSETGENYEKHTNNRLKSLEMALCTSSKWRNINLRDTLTLDKDWESVVFEPRPSVFLPSSCWVRGKLHWVLVLPRTQFSLPGFPSLRAIFLEGAGPQHFSSCLQLPIIIEAKFWAMMAKRW